MSYKLKIRAFFFNAKTDYLPYYKIFSIQLSENATAKELLEAVKLQNENFSYPEINLVFKVNNLVVDEKVSVSQMVERFGNSLKIDPVTSYRSNNGLVINDDDFMQSFELLAPYLTSSDKEYYQSLYALHYASETSNFQRQYIGDAILILAHKMITEGNTHKAEILHAISSVNSGLLDCEYENNLFNAQDYTQVIKELKDMVKHSYRKNRFSIVEIIKNKLPKKDESDDNAIEYSKDTLNETHIAYNIGRNKEKEELISQTIIDLGAKKINTERQYKLSGLSLIEDNKTLAYQKAGATLLDAYDAGAEILIFEDSKTCHMIKQHFSSIEKTIGRKIIRLDIVTADEFIAQITTTV